MANSIFEPVTFRNLTLRNRITASPMCQYSAVGGIANDWHLVHLGRFALGGFGLVIVEATAVSPEGRISYGDMGLWRDEQIEPLRRIVDFLHSQGCMAGIQLAHAGRKASTPIPWRGGFTETAEERARLGFESWPPVAPSALPHGSTSVVPEALDDAGLAKIRADFAAATERAQRAGFDVIELHAAHGYLLNQFLAPSSNHRADQYGGSPENRMRFPLEIAATIREVWSADKPLFARISCVDGLADGWNVEDSIVLARAFGERGVDLIDCSSGGFDGAVIRPAPLYQAAYAETIRREAKIATAAVGLITTPAEAAAIIEDGRADLVVLARAALDDPNWPVHARRELDSASDDYGLWPRQVGYAVRAKDRVLGASQSKLGLRST